MLYLKWAAFLLPSFLMEIVGKVGAPILAFFVRSDGWLPHWLWWFQPPDNSCDGDEGHRARWPRDGWFWTWARRTAWLVRNTAYGFHIDVLGISVKASDYVAIFGDPKIGDRSGISGWCRWNVYRGAKLIAWQFYFVHHYKIFGVWKCVRLGIGWKCWGVKPFNAQHWLYFHPLKGSGRNG